MAEIRTKKNTNTIEASSDKEQASVPIPAGMRDVLIAPRLSEKASHLAESGKYVFRVSVHANKVEVKKAIEKSYKVKVVQVNMITLRGRQRNFGRTLGKTGDIKKAIVTLSPGQKLEGSEAA